MTFNTPTLLWSQTPESIDISIRLSNIESESVSCENNHFYFSCSSQSKDYWIEFDLDKAVEKVSYNKYDNRIAIVLEKADYEKWDFLTKVKGIYKNNIKIDWDKWADSDAEEEGENQGSQQAPSSGFGGMDMNMMQQMMGGGGMDMNMMQQMMGGMNMGGHEEEGDEGEGDEEEGDEGEGDEEEGDEGEGDEGEGDEGEGDEEECDEGEGDEEEGDEGEGDEGEGDEGEGESCANEE